MDHNAYKELLSALLDGELSGAEREAALTHLETCADCRAYFHELTALRAALRGMEEFDAPEGFAAGVLARLRAEGVTTRPRAGDTAPDTREADAPKPSKTRFPLRRYAALAACAAVVLLAVYALPGTLRMGGGSQNVVADRAASVSSAPAATQGAPAPADAPAAAPEEPAAPAPSPGSGSNYAYANGGESGGHTTGTALESARAGNGEEDTAASAAENSSAKDDAADNGAYVTEDTHEKLVISNDGEAPMAPLSRPEAHDGELPVLTLTGAGAAGWLAEHGWQGESGAWYVEADALRALPEGLTVVYGELSEGYDGVVLIELWLVEPSAGEAEP